MGGDILSHVLRIHRQHPDNALSDLGKIDYSISAALSPSRRTPTEFAYAARARNDVPSFRIIHQDFLKLMVLVVIQIFLNKASKEPSLNEAEIDILYGIAVWSQEPKRE
jgi:hypothetical protein